MTAKEKIRNERIKAIREIIKQTKRVMSETPEEGIAGTIIEPHSVLMGYINEAERQIEELKKDD